MNPSRFIPLWLGGRVLTQKSVKEVLKTNGVTSGVECGDGSTIEADMVIFAMGSWTASTFPELSLEERCISTGLAYLVRSIVSLPG
jgi:sarcosine oxidase / L-pipecolate oxidase